MKTFVEFIKEDTTTANVVGTGDDPADWMNPRKKKRKSIVTKHYIEVAGKIKRQMR